MIGKQRRKPPNPKKIKKGSTLSPVVIEDNNSGREESEPEKELEMVNKQKKNDRNRRSQEDSDGGSTSGSESEKDDEEEWKILQQSMEKHKKKKFDKVSTKSYPVHAPYFPEVRRSLSNILLVVMTTNISPYRRSRNVGGCTLQTRD